MASQANNTPREPLLQVTRPPEEVMHCTEPCPSQQGTQQQQLLQATPQVPVLSLRPPDDSWLPGTGAQRWTDVADTQLQARVSAGEAPDYRAQVISSSIKKRRQTPLLLLPQLLL